MSSGRNYGGLVSWVFHGLGTPARSAVEVCFRKGHTLLQERVRWPASPRADALHLCQTIAEGSRIVLCLEIPRTAKSRARKIPTALGSFRSPGRSTSN